jgi:predicted anti-sigma-YlaC factor YlaD
MGNVKAGLLGGVAGGVIVWIYEAVVWVSIQHTLTIPGMFSNAVGLVFGKATQASLGFAAYLLGTGIHFFFSLAWGVLFALTWPWFRRRGYEATLVGLLYAVLAWIVMHAAIAAVSSSHPDYLDPTVVIGGFMSHFFFTVPMALLIKRLQPATGG